MDPSSLLESNENTLVKKQKLREIVQQLAPEESLDDDVENALLDLCDDFIYNVTQSACRLAKHRGSDSLELKDLQLHLETMYNIRIPGFGLDEVRPLRKQTIPTGHQQRISQVKKAVINDIMNEKKEKIALNSGSTRGAGSSNTSR